MVYAAYISKYTYFYAWFWTHLHWHMCSFFPDDFCFTLYIMSNILEYINDKEIIWLWDKVFKIFWLL